MSRNVRSARGFPIGPIISRSTMRPGAPVGGVSRVTGDLLALDFSVYGAPPTLDSYVRTGTIWAPAKYESGFGERVESFGANVIPQMYHAGLVSAGVASGIGFAYEVAQTSLIGTGADRDTSGWTVSNVTHAANQEDAPDVEETPGTLSDTFTATADNGYAQTPITTVAASSYSYQAMIRRSAGAAAVTGRLIAYDVTGVAEDGAVAFSVTDEWERVTLNRIAATSTSSALRIEIDTSGDAVAVDFACAMLDGDGTFVPAGATRPVPSSCHMTNTGGNTVITPVRGEVRATVIGFFRPVAAGGYVYYDTRDPANHDRNLMYEASSRRLNGSVYDAAGALATSAQISTDTLADTVYEIRHRWDSTAVIPGYSQHSDIWRGATRVAGSDTDGWTTDIYEDVLHIGHDYRGGTFQPMHALMAYLDIFSTPQADPA